MKYIFIIITLFFSKSVYGLHNEDKIQYKKDTICISALSLGRDIAISKQMTKLNQKLIGSQNEIYLQHPVGHFKPAHVEAQKLLHKIRLNDKGITYLISKIIDCGFDSKLIEQINRN